MNSILSYDNPDLELELLTTDQPTKICQACNRPFLPYGKRNRDRLKYCNRVHYRICPICGKEYKADLSGGLDCVQKSCSRKCGNILRKRAQEESMLRMHGVSNPGQLSDHQAKVAQTCLDKYGVESYSQSEEFKKKAQATWRAKTPEELQARLDKSTATNLARYGVPNGSQSAQAKAKQIQTNRRRYGKDWYRQTDECRRRIAETTAARYGDEVYFRTLDYKEKSKQTSLIRYGVPHHTQSPEFQDRMRQKNLEELGVTCVFQTEENRQRLIQANHAKYGVNYTFERKDIQQKSQDTMKERYGVAHGFQSQEIQKSAQKSLFDMYGTTHAGQVEFIRHKISETCRSSEVRQKFEDTMLAKYGVTNPMYSTELRRRCAVNTKKRSSLEIRLHHMLENYHIDYEIEYVIKKDDVAHSFDVYLPQYHLLIDVDGSYYHAYDSDPNGKQVRDDYDDVRLYCVPEDSMYVVLVESDFERELRRLQKILDALDQDLFNYDSEIFQWCRVTGFPYYNYDEAYLRKQYENLCKYTSEVYHPSCEIGISIIQQFHPSIFDCHVGSHKSVREAWDDDALLKKVIANRLIYQNNVRPSKILTGFNISKIAPKVSVFNPILARRLVMRYLSEFDTVFDPFSGFSGRLLGVASTGRRYVGHDLNSTSVSESNQIIQFLDLDDTCSVIEEDIFDTSGSYECLLTCSPYNGKEIYGSETAFMSCDDWIDECLKRFDCKRYVFVVDKTSRFSEFVAEELKQKSHFRKSSELVIVIDK